MARVTRRTSTRRKLRRSGMKSRSRTVVRRGRVVGRRTPRPLISRYALNPFPKTRICRHRYVEVVTLPASASAGVCQQYCFRANGIFDPNQTGSGHQPLYRDELAARYTNYIVLDAYIEVVYDQESTQQKFYGIVLQDSTSVGLSPETNGEQYGFTGPVIGAQRNKPLKLRKSFSAARDMKTSVRALMADDAAKTPVGQDPSSTKIARYFVLWGCADTATAVSAAELITVKITYVVAWLDPNDATGS